MSISLLIRISDRDFIEPFSVSDKWQFSSSEIILDMIKLIFNNDVESNGLKAFQEI
jgi:hypothetical protein